jgi:hypothetical protein
MTIEDLTLSPQKETKICVYCGTSMPALASVCYQCRQNQKRWKNHLRFDNFGQVLSLLIALLMMLIALQQLQEARIERIAAKDALEKAREAEKTAKSIGNDLTGVQTEVQKQRNTINTMADDARKSSYQIQKDAASLRSYMSETKTSLNKEIKTLADESTIQKERNDIVRLEQDATIAGNASALNELEKRVEIPALKEFALSAIIRVKQFYLFAPPLRGMSFRLVYSLSDGTMKYDSELPTYILIERLRFPVWSARAKVVMLLGERKEKGVPEVLLNAMQDDRLDVAVNALRSFKVVTGYTGHQGSKSKDFRGYKSDDDPGAIMSEDIFGFDQAKEWWSRNKSEIDKKLKAQDTK